MTKEDISKIAIQAGWDEHHAMFDTRIEKFAKFVAEKESEECAKIAEWHKQMAFDIRARGQE